MKYTLLILLFFFSINLSFSQDVVRMTKEGGVYTMPCEVNGLKLRFIFDTGASDVSISFTEAMFMLKNGYLAKSDIKGSTYYQIANGDIVEGTTINLRTIKIGNRYLYNVDASIVHSTSSPLLLGQSALKKLGKFSFDYSNNTLVFGGNNNNSEYKRNYDYRPSYNEESNYSYTTTMKMAGKLRSSDSPMSTVLKHIPANTTVRVIGNKDDYWKVFYDGKTGYLNEIYLNVTYNMSTMQKKKGNDASTSSYKNYEITTMKMAGKLRSSDSPMSTVIKSIPKNATVRVIGRKDDYWKVFYDGKTGYLNEIYLKVTYDMTLMKN